jgi:monofunctional biosynthetic peptidoglycan transglycosylase
MTVLSLKKKIASIIKKILIVFFVSSIFFTILYRFINPPITPLMLIRFTQQLFQKDRDIRFERDYVSIHKISPKLIQAAIAAEDNLFLTHWGFDFKQIMQARKDAKKGKRVRGASTISQQCAKNVFLYPQHSWIRKGLEVYFTFLIELCWSKERIMEVYLNVIEYGDGIYGAEAASMFYFQKPAKSLTKREASLMVACFPNPLKRNPSHPSRYITQRAYKIRTIMDLIGPINLKK